MATALTTTAEWLQITGRGYLVYEMTGSVSALGQIYFLSYAAFLVAPLFGVLADRFDRRTLVIGGHSTMAACSVSLAVLAARGEASFAVLAVLSCIGGIVIVTVEPAQQALAPSLVPAASMPSAVALQSTVGNAARIVGPLVGGALIPLVGVAWLFAIAAVSSLVLAAVWWRVRLAAHPRSSGRPLAALLEGLAYARANAAVRVPLLLLLGVCMTSLLFQPLALAYATAVVADGDTETGARFYGITQATIGASAVLGIACAARTVRRRPGLTLLATTAAAAVGVGALAASEGPGGALVGCAVLGAGTGATVSSALTLIQLAAPADLQGRMLGLFFFAWTGTLPLTGLLAGAAAEAFGLAQLLAACSLGCAALGVVMVRPLLRLASPADGAPAGGDQSLVPEPAERTPEPRT